MAHSDALIFLTNITWVFFLFLFSYFFFVVFALPTFYKKFRMRVLLKQKTFLSGLLSTRDLISTVLLRVELLVDLYSVIASSAKNSVHFFSGTLPSSSSPASTQVDAASDTPITSALNFSNHIVYSFDTAVESSTQEGVVFTKYIR